jgi:hypothetical protein
LAGELVFAAGAYGGRVLEFGLNSDTVSKSGRQPYSLAPVRG